MSLPSGWWMTHESTRKTQEAMPLRPCRSAPWLMRGGAWTHSVDLPSSSAHTLTHSHERTNDKRVAHAPMRAQHSSTTQ
jgi:hypothetical protein